MSSRAMSTRWNSSSPSRIFFSPLNLYQEQERSGANVFQWQAQNNQSTNFKDRLQIVLSEVDWSVIWPVRWQVMNAIEMRYFIEKSIQMVFELNVREYTRKKINKYNSPMRLHIFLSFCVCLIYHSLILLAEITRCYHFIQFDSCGCCLLHILNVGCALCVCLLFIYCVWWWWWSCQIQSVYALLYPCFFLSICKTYTHSQTRLHTHSHLFHHYYKRAIECLWMGFHHSHARTHALNHFVIWAVIWR